MGFQKRDKRLIASARAKTEEDLLFEPTVAIPEKIIKSVEIMLKHSRGTSN
jgi:hypothetical protein